MPKYRALVNIQFSTWGFAKPGEVFEIDSEVDSNIAELLTEAEPEPEAEEEAKPKRSRRKPEEDAE